MTAFTKKYFSSFLLVTALLLPAASSWASTAANTEIVNTVTLTYNGALKASASCSVTVALLPATPNIDISRGEAIYTDVDTPSLTNTVTITATANGPASYTVSATVIAATNISSSATVQPSVSGSGTISLGASITTGASGTTYVTVPAPIGVSGSNASEINGIAVGDTIVFTVNGTPFIRVVTSFTDNGDRTYRINWTGAIMTPAPAGTQVGERALVNLQATPGTIATLGKNLTTTVQAVVSTPGAPADAIAATSPPNLWTSSAPRILFKKYSRNASNPDGNPPFGSNGSSPFEINSKVNFYFTSGVTARQGEKIEYVLAAINTGTTDLTACAIVDQIPVTFVSDPLPAYGGGSNIFYTDTNGLTFQLQTGAAGTSQASYAAPNLNITVGVDATATSGGIIPLSKRVTVAYQVKVK